MTSDPDRSEDGVVLGDDGLARPAFRAAFVDFDPDRGADVPTSSEETRSGRHTLVR